MMPYLCKTEGCHTQVARGGVCPRCLRYARKCAAKGCYVRVVAGERCERHRSEKIKFLGRWRTREEAVTRIMRSPEMSGVEWREETVTRRVPLKGVDEHGYIVAAGTQTQARTQMVGTLGGFHITLWRGWWMSCDDLATTRPDRQTVGIR